MSSLRSMRRTVRHIMIQRSPFFLQVAFSSLRRSPSPLCHFINVSCEVIRLKDVLEASLCGCTLVLRRDFEPVECSETFASDLDALLSFHGGSHPASLVLRLQLWPCLPSRLAACGFRDCLLCPSYARHQRKTRSSPYTRLRFRWNFLVLN